MHDFQTGTVIEGDEPAGELFCRVVVNRVDYPTEVLPVELTNLIDISDPNGNMFNLHKTSINNIPNSSQKDPLKREHVSRETQSRIPSKNILVCFYLVFAECRTTM